MKNQSNAELMEKARITDLLTALPAGFELWHTAPKDDGTEWVVFLVNSPDLQRFGDGKTPLEALENTHKMKAFEKELKRRVVS
jgi:hypothetical protein